MNTVVGRDAAYASNIGSGFGGVVAGYIGGPLAYHIWQQADWIPFKNNPKVPIWVCGYGGADEGTACVTALQKLGVKPGVVVAADMETRIDETYLMAFWQVLNRAGYLTLVYGSRSTVFSNPQLNGYWVADYTGQAHMATNPNTGDTIGVRGTQWTSGPDFDTSEWKAWVTQQEMWR